jgi:hypothetical protein
MRLEGALHTALDAAELTSQQAERNVAGDRAPVFDQPCDQVRQDLGRFGR